MRDFAHFLPSGRGLRRDLTLAEAEKYCVGFCGDTNDGKEVHKLLTREWDMLTYERDGSKLIYVGSSPLHDVTWT